MPANGANLPAGHFSSKPLWAAIVVLGVAVVALGASLIHVYTRLVDSHAVFAIPATPSEAAPSQQASPAAPLPVTTVAADEAVVLPARTGPVDKPTTKSMRTSTTSAKRATAPVAAPAIAAAPAASYPPATAPAPAPAPAPQAKVYSTDRY